MLLPVRSGGEGERMTDPVPPKADHIRDIAAFLRALAEKIEAGEVGVEEVTQQAGNVTKTRIGHAHYFHVFTGRFSVSLACVDVKAAEAYRKEWG